MKLYVPDIGDKITLSEDWTFSLFQERRNIAFLKTLNLPHSYSNQNYQTATLPAGTELIVDRIYIKKGHGFEDFSSLTFRIVEKPFKGRFWAKLTDVNEIIYGETGLAKRDLQVKLSSARDLSLSTQIRLYYKNPNEVEAVVENIKSYIDKPFELRQKEEIDASLPDNLKSLMTISGHRLFLEDKNKKKVVDKKLRIKYMRTIVAVNFEKKRSPMFGILNSALHSSNSENYYTITVVNVYELYDDETLLGSWKSAESLVKKAKQYLTDLANDPAYKRNETTSDFFS